MENMRISVYISTALGPAWLALWAYLAYQNAEVKHLLGDGWTPVVVSMILSSVAGVLFARFNETYIGLALLLPVFNGKRRSMMHTLLRHLYTNHCVT